MRADLPQYDLGEMKDLHVPVVPKGVSVQPFGRGSCQYRYLIDVGVQQKLIDTSPAAVAPLLASWTRSRTSSGSNGCKYPDAMWAKTEHPHLYAQEHLEQLRQFTSVLTLTFRAVR